MNNDEGKENRRRQLLAARARCLVRMTEEGRRRIEQRGQLPVRRLAKPSASQPALRHGDRPSSELKELVANFDRGLLLSAVANSLHGTLERLDDSEVDFGQLGYRDRDLVTTKAEIAQTIGEVCGELRRMDKTSINAVSTGVTRRDGQDWSLPAPGLKVSASKEQLSEEQKQMREYRREFPPEVRAEARKRYESARTLADILGPLPLEALGDVAPPDEASPPGGARSQPPQNPPGRRDD